MARPPTTSEPTSSDRIAWMVTRLFPPPADGPPPPLVDREANEVLLPCCAHHDFSCAHFGWFGSISTSEDPEVDKVRPL